MSGTFLLISPAFLEKEHAALTCIKNIAEALDRWYEDLQDYEQNLESMASASLDARFKDELQHVDQWFSYLNEAERTTTVYTLLQHSSPVQIRFFITVLQQMGKKDPLGSLLSPAYPEKGKRNRRLRFPFSN